MALFFKSTAPKKQTNNILKNVKIEKLDHHGRGLSFYQNKPLFIDGALVGESLDIKLIETKKNYSKGVISKINLASDLRIKPTCPHFDECGACHLQHMDQNTQLTLKSEGLISLFKRFAKHDPNILEETIKSNEWGYRRTARFGLQYDKKRKVLNMGFRKGSTNDLIDQNVCPVIEPSLERLITPLKELLRSLKIKSELGHVELILADQGVVVLLRYLKPLPSVDLMKIQEFSKEHGLNFYGQPEKKTYICLAGAKTLSYQLKQWETTLNFGPSDFIQINVEINNKMVAQALNWLDLKETDKVLDLFCGLGNFSLPTAKQVDTLVGIEGVQEMVDRANSNAKSCNIDNANFYQADLSSLDSYKDTWAKNRYTKILLDPARAGAGSCMNFLAKTKAKKIVYVSCDPLTLAKDSQTLLEKGYKLEKLGLIDMFPQTKHMESMALFSL